MLVLTSACTDGAPFGLLRLPPAENQIHARTGTETRPAYDIRRAEVRVSRALTVSEENQIYPWADIVWRGDPPGDRYDQISTIFNAVVADLSWQMQTGAPVILVIDVRGFHALTEKARYGYGGNYSISFDLALRDATSGVELRPAERINIIEPAAWGQQAADNEARGQTQKVVVTRLITEAIERHLSRPLAPGA
ncbi:hypothetical protein LZA78_13885 [Sinirhodobacter sp. WL0062]|uniref:ABC-type transport auxiliary lipoprotein component domain-containing protein n=1 Tax=Rhodobacter flavimaris TaxID=2907145 RepID=A0ABS8YXP4_9RHOB|nr:DUF6778 family protein [Sinirhodobacter sp. WL0062]MCE5974574.1 hypothetical protein [Sinirhodobacter sp. WL0062]